MNIKTLDCRHGKFSFYADDDFIGKSLDLYGEYSEDEVNIFGSCLLPGHTVVEVGSNIGTHTVPMAKLVGPTGKVISFEPQPENFSLLKTNIEQNNLSNVELHQQALGSRKKKSKIASLSQLTHKNYGMVEVGSGQNKIDVVRLDSYKFDKLRFIKIDAEGSEKEVLEGAEKTIKKFRPILYVENDRPDKAQELVSWLIDHNYRCWWHWSPLFNKNNHFNNKKNSFGTTLSYNMFCTPSEKGAIVSGLDELSDPRTDSDLYSREVSRKMKIVEIFPKDLDARFQAAHFANMNLQHDLARELIKGSLEIDPKHIATLTLQGLLDLQAGNFKDGWPAYELRFEHHKNVKYKFGFLEYSQPRWDGKPTNDVILVHSEQGFGDTIMFVRFMDEVLKRAPNAILSVQPSLFELIENSGIVPKGQLFRQYRALSDFKAYCSIPSLPATLGLSTEAEIIRPAYLKAESGLTTRWKEKNDNPKVGICLTGGVLSERAYSRNVPPEAMKKILDEFGPFMNLANEGQWDSFSDTAAAISNLEMVITVDTSIGHLAGALGIPTILLLSTDPDWRWQCHREDTPWYPSVKIFRQKRFMDWSNVVDDVYKEMKAFEPKKINDLYQYTYDIPLELAVNS